MSTPGGGLVKPRALRKGSRLAVVSPASATRRDLVDLGLRVLEADGFAVELMPHALNSGPLYYAGAAEQRAADLHEAFRDPEVDGIVCTRGGWGSAELLPLLDAALIRAHPKPFIGYSDHTSLHLWLQQECGLTTFYGPMVAADFAHPDGVDNGSWSKSLMQAEPWDLRADSGLRVLQAGTAEGVLVGGCLAIVAESLGTPFAPRWTEPAILFLEDVGVKPYQWDRMLLHLLYAGVLEHVTGIVFGDMTQSASPEDQGLLEQAILHALCVFPGPIAIGLRCGHVNSGNVTLPLGVRSRLTLSTAGEPRLQLLEGAVTL